MSRRGLFRAGMRLARSLERADRRRRHEVMRQRGNLARMQERERAQWEVDNYQTSIEQITTLHKVGDPPLDWEGYRGDPKHGRLAEAVLAGDPAAYGHVIEASGCLSELIEIGVSPTGAFPRPDIAEATLQAGRRDDVIPTEEKQLGASGRLMSRAIQPAKRQELYQLYVAGIAIKLARDLLAALPLRAVLVHVYGGEIDRATGHAVKSCILSALFPRDRVEATHFENVDPTAMVRSLTHAVSVSRTGFQPVEPLKLDDVAPA